MNCTTATPAPTAHDIAVATAVREVESAIAAVERVQRATENLDTTAGVNSYVTAVHAQIDLEAVLDDLRARPVAADVSTPMCTCGHPLVCHTATPAVGGRAGCRAKSATSPGRCACERTS